MAASNHVGHWPAEQGPVASVQDPLDPDWQTRKKNFTLSVSKRPDPWYPNIHRFHEKSNLIQVKA